MSDFSLLNRLLKIYAGKPRVAIMMSGKGTNAERILQQRHRYPNINFCAIFTDKGISNACQIAQKHQLDYICLENKKSLTRKERERYFKEASVLLEEQKIESLIYAGFMKITPKFFLEKFPGINVHPADLTILSSNFQPKYVGMSAIQDAI